MTEGRVSWQKASVGFRRIVRDGRAPAQRTIGEQPVDRNIAFDYRRTLDQTRLGSAPPLIGASAKRAARRFSPLVSLIVVAGVSLVIWVAIWGVLSSLLRG